jgi:proteasome lid subunit RPN8/RPN11
MSADNSAGLFDLDIEPRGRETSKFVFLPRPDRNPDFVLYTAPGIAGVVYIYRPAFEQMRKIALEAAPNETIGMLCGRPCMDDEGVYTLVMAVERARPGEYVGTPGSVRISAGGKAALKARAAQRWPGMEDVGWFHTHPRGEARFSNTDFDEQSTLVAHHVGIVASVDRYMSRRGDPLGVYLGPAGVRLAGTRTPIALPAPPEAPVKPNVQGKPKYFTPEMLKQLRVGTVVIVALLALSQALTATWVRGAIKDHEASAGNLVEPTPVVSSPAPGAITKRVVRLTPALLAARKCSPGEQVRFAARVPRTFRDGLAVESLDTGIATADYDVAKRRVSVECLTVGDTVVEVRHGASGAAAAVAISVNTSPPRVTP